MSTVGERARNLMVARYDRASRRARDRASFRMNECMQINGNDEQPPCNCIDFYLKEAHDLDAIYELLRSGKPIPPEMEAEFLECKREVERVDHGEPPDLLF